MKSITVEKLLKKDSVSYKKTKFFFVKSILFQETRILIMETILPPNLLPIPAANAMLLVGSKIKECDCEFPLAHFLLISGIIGL